MSNARPSQSTVYTPKSGHNCLHRHRESVQQAVDVFCSSCRRNFCVSPEDAPSTVLCPRCVAARAKFSIRSSSSQSDHQAMLEKLEDLTDQLTEMGKRMAKLEQLVAITCEMVQKERQPTDDQTANLGTVDAEEELEEDDEFGTVEEDGWFFYDEQKRDFVEAPNAMQA